MKVAEENVTKTYHPKVFIGKIAAYPELQLRHALKELARLSANGNVRELYRFLQEFLPEAQFFQHETAFRTEAMPSGKVAGENDHSMTTDDPPEITKAAATYSRTPALQSG